MTKAFNEDMNGTSAWGVDGFTLNFIRKFWTPLGALVVNAVNNSKSKGKLTTTLRTAIFKLLRKGDKDPSKEANFSPISFISAFYKIASCVIKNVIKKIDQMLSKMDRNFEDWFKKVKEELTSWKFRYLTVFDKITVMKTMCLPKFTHVSTVIKSLSITKINEIEKEFNRFINDNTPL